MWGTLWGTILCDKFFDIMEGFGQFIPLILIITITVVVIKLRNKGRQNRMKEFNKKHGTNFKTYVDFEAFQEKERGKEWQKFEDNELWKDLKRREQNPSFRKKNSSSTASPVYYIARCFAGYVEFNGRANRAEFWYFYLFSIIMHIIAASIDINVFKFPPEAIGSVSSATSLVLLLPTLSVGCRRLHDIGKSGWWQLISFTIIGIIPLIIWFASEGNIASTNTNKKTSVKSQEVGTAAKLRELNQLYKEGVLTKKEFTEAKKKYLK